MLMLFYRQCVGTQSSQRECVSQTQRSLSTHTGTGRQGENTLGKHFCSAAAAAAGELPCPHDHVKVISCPVKLSHILQDLKEPFFWSPQPLTVEHLNELLIDFMFYGLISHNDPSFN